MPAALLPALPGWVWAAMIVIVFAAAIVQAGLGMGFGLTAAPLLALIEPAFVPGPALVLGFATALWGALRERRHIAWGEVATGTWGRLAGVVIGASILAATADRDAFLLVFGLLVALAVLLSVFRWRLPFNAATLVAMGTVSGTMGIITSVGAPPMALIYQNRTPADARPTLAAFFAVGCVISIAGLIASGWFGARELALAATMFPAMIAGTLFASRLRGRFDRRYRPLLLATAAIAAAILIARGLT